MKICDDCNIVYENRYCPLCEAKEEIAKLETQRDDLNYEIQHHECEISQ